MQTSNDEIVMFLRVNELEVGDLFLYDGAWRKVMKITGGRLTYRINTESGKRNVATVSSKSQLFVEARRNNTC